MKAAFLAVIVVVLGLQGSSVNAQLPGIGGVVGVVSGVVNTVLVVATTLLNTLLATVQNTLQGLLNTALPGSTIISVNIDLSQLGSIVNGLLDLTGKIDLQLNAAVKIRLANLDVIDCTLWLRASLSGGKLLDVKLTCPAPLGLINLPGLPM